MSPLNVLRRSCGSSAGLGRGDVPAENDRVPAVANILTRHLYAIGRRGDRS